MLSKHTLFSFCVTEYVEGECHNGKCASSTERYSPVFPGFVENHIWPCGKYMRSCDEGIPTCDVIYILHSDSEFTCRISGQYQVTLKENLNRFVVTSDALSNSRQIILICDSHLCEGQG